jgi:DNA topoisomerase VI subunit A
VQFYEDGDLIDCTRMGVGGKAIPPYIDKITDVTSDAKFILVRQTHTNKAQSTHTNTFTDTCTARKG